MATVTLYNRSGETLGDDLTLAFTGERAGSLTAVQLPTKAGRYFRVKAAGDNAGVVCLGLSTSVTLPNGSTDATTGWPLAAGEETGWLPLTNLDVLWMICTNAADDIVYWVLA